VETSPIGAIRSLVREIETTQDERLNCDNGLKHFVMVRSTHPSSNWLKLNVNCCNIGNPGGTGVSGLIQDCNFSG
jgi:hypothetical protein